MTALASHPARHGLVLGLFSLAAAVILSTSHSVTEAAIAERKAEDLLASLAQVVPTERHDNDVAKTLVTLTDEIEGRIDVHLATQKGLVTGTAFELTGFGYAGAIRVLMGVAPDGSLMGVRVLAHAETPGLGDKIEIRKDDWVKSFDGKSLGNPAPEGWAVIKDGGVFDQFSGATITPRAVVDTVRRGLELFDRHRLDLLQPVTGAAA